MKKPVSASFAALPFALLFVLLLAACGGQKTDISNPSASAAGAGQEPSASGPSSGSDEKKTITFGATAGPYSDQIKLGIKPILEKKGYTVEIVEFNDYIQPNLALAGGDLDANVFQHSIYLERFSSERKLELTNLLQVPTAPIGIYSKEHQSLDEAGPGTSVALPNDPANQARALVMMQQFGWLKLKDGVDPIKVSEKDVAENIKKIKLLPLEAAQLPRSLESADYSFINGNFALASGLTLEQSLGLEQIPDHYMNIVAVKTADKDKPFVKDIEDAYRSAEFKQLIEAQFKGFVLPDYLK